MSTRRREIKAIWHFFSFNPVSGHDCIAFNILVCKVTVRIQCAQRSDCLSVRQRQPPAKRTPCIYFENIKAKIPLRRIERAACCCWQYQQCRTPNTTGIYRSANIRLVWPAVTRSRSNSVNRQVQAMLFTAVRTCSRVHDACGHNSAERGGQGVLTVVQTSISLGALVLAACYTCTTVTSYHVVPVCRTRGVIYLFHSLFKKYVRYRRARFAVFCVVSMSLDVSFCLFRPPRRSRSGLRIIPTYGLRLCLHMSTSHVCVLSLRFTPAEGVKRQAVWPPRQITSILCLLDTGYKFCTHVCKESTSRATNAKNTPNIFSGPCG